MFQQHKRPHIPPLENAVERFYCSEMQLAAPAMHNCSSYLIVRHPANPEQGVESARGWKSDFVTAHGTERPTLGQPLNPDQKLQGLDTSSAQTNLTLNFQAVR